MSRDLALLLLLLLLLSLLFQQLKLNDTSVTCIQVACTSWLKTLATAAGKKNPSDEFVHFGNLNKYLRRFFSFSPLEKEEILRNHFKFMFVRHPFERLISAYLDKLRPGSEKNM